MNAHTDPPIATVLIRVYNGEAYLAEAVESALAQTEKNIEVVVVDDGSVDSSAAILRVLAHQDPRVHVIEEEHRGLVATITRGLEAARGKYICILDADDIAMPDRVAKQVAFLEAHHDFVLVGGQVAIVNKQGEMIGTMDQPLEEIETTLRSINCLAHSSVLYRREEIVLAGGYDPAFPVAEDYDLWVRLAEKFRLGNLPDFVCRYRVHENQVSSSTILRQSFTMMCIRAVYRGASRETIRESVRAEERDFIRILRSLGYTENEIAGGVIGGYLSWITRLRKTGDLVTAFKLVSETTRHLRRLKCDSVYFARVYSVGTLASLDARRYARAARYLAQALVSSPGETSRSVFKKLSALFQTRELDLNER